MMELSKKFNRYKEIYDKYFMPVETGIPLESVNFDNKVGFMGDGTINLALDTQYRVAAGFELGTNIATLFKLQQLPFKLACDKEPTIPFTLVEGFFMRDDVDSSKAKYYNLDKVITSYTSAVERINEDPCWSNVVSQDQVWNLAPILKYIWWETGYNWFGQNMFKYVCDNKHTIYDPYYSTYCHYKEYYDLNVPYEDRLRDRTDNLKYNKKVKRGANNWYFAYGFKRCLEAFGGEAKGKFLAALWYIPFIFLADRVWEPIVKLFGGSVKNNSYYSLATTSGVWYTTRKRFEKRLIKRFNKSLKSGGELFMPHLVFLLENNDKIDRDGVRKWLENYPEPEEKGVMQSPIMFMILYSWLDGPEEFYKKV